METLPDPTPTSNMEVVIDKTRIVKIKKKDIQPTMDMANLSSPVQEIFLTLEPKRNNCNTETIETKDNSYTKENIVRVDTVKPQRTVNKKLGKNITKDHSTIYDEIEKKIGKTKICNFGLVKGSKTGVKHEGCITPTEKKNETKNIK